MTATFILDDSETRLLVQQGYEQATRDETSILLRQFGEVVSSRRPLNRLDDSLFKGHVLPAE